MGFPLLLLSLRGVLALDFGVRLDLLLWKTPESGEDVRRDRLEVANSMTNNLTGFPTSYNRILWYIIVYCDTVKYIVVCFSIV